jgi:hypothetical protein
MSECPDKFGAPPHHPKAVLNASLRRVIPVVAIYEQTVHPSRTRSIFFRVWKRIPGLRSILRVITRLGLVTHDFGPLTTASRECRVNLRPRKPSGLRGSGLTVQICGSTLAHDHRETAKPCCRFVDS